MPYTRRVRSRSPRYGDKLHPLCLNIAYAPNDGKNTPAILKEDLFYPRIGKMVAKLTGQQNYQMNIFFMLDSKSTWNFGIYFCFENEYGVSEQVQDIIRKRVIDIIYTEIIDEEDVLWCAIADLLVEQGVFTELNDDLEKLFVASDFTLPGSDYSSHMVMNFVNGEADFGSMRFDDRGSFDAVRRSVCRNAIELKGVYLEDADYNSFLWKEGRVGRTREHQPPFQNEDVKRRCYEQVLRNDPNGPPHYEQTAIIREHQEYFSGCSRYTTDIHLSDVLSSLRENFKAVSPDIGYDFKFSVPDGSYITVKRWDKVGRNHGGWLRKMVRPIDVKARQAERIEAVEADEQPAAHLPKDVGEAKALACKLLDEHVSHWDHDDIHTEHPKKQGLIFIRRSICPYSEKEWCQSYSPNGEVRQTSNWKPSWRPKKNPASCLACWDHWTFTDQGSDPPLHTIHELIQSMKPSPVKSKTTERSCYGPTIAHGDTIYIIHCESPSALRNIDDEHSAFHGKVFALFPEDHPIPQDISEVYDARDGLRQKRSSMTTERVISGICSKVHDHEEIDKSSQPTTIRCVICNEKHVTTHDRIFHNHSRGHLEKVRHAPVPWVQRAMRCHTGSKLHFAGNGKDAVDCLICVKNDGSPYYVGLCESAYESHKWSNHHKKKVDALEWELEQRQGKSNASSSSRPLPETPRPRDRRKRF